MIDSIFGEPELHQFYSLFDADDTEDRRGPQVLKQKSEGGL